MKFSSDGFHDENFLAAAAFEAERERVSHEDVPASHCYNLVVYFTSTCPCGSGCGVE